MTTSRSPFVTRIPRAARAVLAVSGLMLLAAATGGCEREAKSPTAPVLMETPAPTPEPTFTPAPTATPRATATPEPRTQIDFKPFKFLPNAPYDPSNGTWGNGYRSKQ